MAEHTTPAIGTRQTFAGQEFMWTGTDWVLVQKTRPGEVPVYIPGPKGERGDTGPAGEPGAPGPSGEPGAKGEKGDTGERGLQGIPGANGAPGEPGPAGAKGDKGDDGAQGPAGVDGAQGAKGDKGDTGAAGADGAPGAPGTKGDKGDQGERGLQGIQGVQGATGAKGDKGDTGNQGLQGVPGVGVPTGGTTGQVLAKSSGTDFATAWINPPSSSAVPSWYGHTHAAYSDGNTKELFERMTTEVGTPLNQNFGPNNIRLIRFKNPATLVVNCLRALCILSYTAANSTFSFALYDDALQKISGDIEMPTGSLTSYTWLKLGDSLGISLTAGAFYYLAITTKNSGSAAPLRCISTGGISILHNLGIPSEFNTQAMTFHTATTTTGTLPSTISALHTSVSSQTGGFPAIFLCNA